MADAGVGAVKNNAQGLGVHVVGSVTLLGVGWRDYREAGALWLGFFDWCVRDQVDPPRRQAAIAAAAALSLQRRFDLLHPVLAPKHLIAHKKRGRAKNAALDGLRGHVLEAVFGGLVVGQAQQF